MKSNGAPTLARVGNTRASTFPGFCGRHDTELFKDIEVGELSLDGRSAFSFAFRAVSLELFNKRRAMEDLEELRLKADAGRPLREQLAIQRYLDASFSGHRKGIRELEDIKARYDDTFRRSAWEEVQYEAVWLDGGLPMAFATGLLPEYSYVGDRLQNLGDLSRDAEHITMTLTVFEHSSLVVFAWLKGEDGIAEKFVRSYLAIPDAQKADAVLSTAFELTENVYVSPSWWSNIPEKTKATLLQQIGNGTPMSLHSGTAMRSRLGLSSALPRPRP